MNTQHPKNSYFITVLPNMETRVRLAEECVTLKQAKKIIGQYQSDYSQDSNATKLDAYMADLSDEDYNEDPIPEFKIKLADANKVLETIFMMKQSQLLGLR